MTAKRKPTQPPRSRPLLLRPRRGERVRRQLRWPDGPVCPRCGGVEHSYITTRRLWKCKACKKQFSVKVGTIFEDSPLGLDKWLPAVWLIANSKNGISSHELGAGARDHAEVGVVHAPPHPARDAAPARSDMFGGEVEVDETLHRREGPQHARGTSARGRSRGGRQPPATRPSCSGMIERRGKVRAHVVEDVKRSTLQSYVRDAVHSGSAVYSDAFPSYVGLDKDFEHRTIDHAVQYVDGNVHTNGIENFWALLKRGLHGTYVSVRPFHLYRYLDERMFTFNERELTDLGRFTLVLQAVAGRRLPTLGLRATRPCRAAARLDPPSRRGRACSPSPRSGRTLSAPSRTSSRSVRAAETTSRVWVDKSSISVGLTTITAQSSCSRRTSDNRNSSSVRCPPLSSESSRSIL